MAFPRRPALPGPERRRPSRVRRWAIPALGAVTPVALIVVNIAVFIVKHLAAFRWSIAILAFVSGMMLNSWIGLKIYRLFQQRYREHALASDVNQDVVLIGGMAVIIAVSFVTALFCYLGLANEASLPNAMTFLTGIFAIAVPFAFQFAFQRLLGRGRKSTGAGLPANPFPGASTLPPPPPPPPPGMGQATERGLERQR
ncbi:MAG: hypothetical protein ABSC16_07950 [Candidatus Dormibacteria bacterium]|jgi:small-conductance mechanosensitive channel